MVYFIIGLVAFMLGWICADTYAEKAAAAIKAAEEKAKSDVAEMQAAAQKVESDVKNA